MSSRPQRQRILWTSVALAAASVTMVTKGLTGAGVDVALIDTGVAPVPALSDKDKWSSSTWN